MQGLPNIEMILSSTPPESNGRNNGWSEPRTRGSGRLIHKCLETEVDQPDYIGYHLHLIPTLLLNMVCSE